MRLGMIYHNEHFNFWHENGQIYKSPKNTPVNLDEHSRPQNMRWECSLALFLHFNDAVFQAKPLEHFPGEITNQL